MGTAAVEQEKTMGSDQERGIHFLYEEIGSVARITLNRPQTLNSLTFEVYAELRDTFAGLNRRPDIRAVIITGQGRGFCSGGDADEIIAQLLERRGEGMAEFTRMTGELTRNICELRKPVVAALNGVTAGAGAADTGRRQPRTR